MSDAYFPPNRWNAQAVLFRAILMSAICPTLAGPAAGTELLWKSPNRYRLLLKVDSRGLSRSNSPASVEVDFVRVLADAEIAGIRARCPRPNRLIDVLAAAATPRWALTKMRFSQADASQALAGGLPSHHNTPLCLWRTGEVSAFRTWYVYAGET